MVLWQPLSLRDTPQIVCREPRTVDQVSDVPGTDAAGYEDLPTPHERRNSRNKPSTHDVAPHGWAHCLGGSYNATAVPGPKTAYALGLEMALGALGPPNMTSPPTPPAPPPEPPCRDSGPMGPRKGLDIVNPDTGEAIAVSRADREPEAAPHRGPLPITNPETGEAIIAPATTPKRKATTPSVGPALRPREGFPIQIAGVWPCPCERRRR